MDTDTSQNAQTGNSGQDSTQQQQADTGKLGWRTELPESLRGHEAFQNYQTKNDLWNGHIELAGKLKDAEGKLVNTIPKLTADATDEQKAAYYRAIGVPEKAEDYDVELAEGQDATLAEWFKGTAFALGMPKDMAKALSVEWNKAIEKIAQAGITQAQKAHDEALEKVKQEWGDDAEVRAETIKQGYKFFGANPILDELLQSDIIIGDRKVKVGNHPGMVNLILEVGKRVSPDTTIQGGSTHPDAPKGMNYDWNKTNGG